jgi:phosphatidylserine/phosphatidylglycerophosphate/cardiolipin synthase-like enzyme
MHFKSKKTGGYVVYAVTGINTVSFAIDFTDADTTGLLGFAVERFDPTEDERYFIYGMKVFESVVTQPDETTAVSTSDHPIQSFVWDDFTAKPDRSYRYFFHPLKGKPKNLDRSAKPVEIGVATEPLYSSHEHDVFFNRGVASSQAYVRRFGNLSPDKLAETDAAKADEARQWLSRDLDEALLKFIDQAKPGDTLFGCFYEFRYGPAADRFKAAVDRGVVVRLILDAKDNSRTDADGIFHDAFPWKANEKAVRDAHLPASAIALWRRNNSSNIQHNKFKVLLKGADADPVEVWTGSTNLSVSGIHGQTNVGHWVRNKDIAAAYRDYWQAMLSDPGSADGDSASETRRKKKAWRDTVEALGPVPVAWSGIPEGVSTVFSPRSGTEVLRMYVDALDEAENLGCVTLAFGINKAFKSALVDNTAQNAVTFLLLEKRDRPNPRSLAPFVPLKASHNIYQAWGSFLRDPIYQWSRETSAFGLGLATHIAYIHSKFLLKDPLGPDPIVITGSANFSDNSVNQNDENMLLIRGDARVADIYFTEFNRLFFHYYFRSVQEALFRGDGTSSNAAADASASLFLKEDDSWLAKYAPGKLRRKRVEAITGMAGTQTI